MSAKIYLPVVEREEGDAVLANESGSELLRGDEDENLACGACKKVLARGVSTRTIFTRFSTPHRLLLQCECGAHNLVQVTRAAP